METYVSTANDGVPVYGFRRTLMGSPNLRAEFRVSGFRLTMIIVEALS